MRHLPARFTKIALIGLLAYSALPMGYVLAQEISNQPRIIENAELAACINHLGQNTVYDGFARVPLRSSSKSLVRLLPTSMPRLLAIQSPLLVSICWPRISCGAALPEFRS